MNRIEDILLELNKAEFDYLRGTREFENILNELKARKEFECWGEVQKDNPILLVETLLAIFIGFLIL